jgi:2-amino-4-hydroxy-6-hydroxymethyldihydropteridine diphosphokinase
MIDAYLGVGSNIRPEENFRKALNVLQHYVDVVAVATVYRTAPIGRPEQGEYLNSVWQIETHYPPEHIKFRILRHLEADLGRRRTTDKYAPRPIDLDLILYGDLVVHSDDLVLPDPDIRTRWFLAVPLLELAPTLILPDTQEPLHQVVEAFGAINPIPEPHIKQQLERMIPHE